MNKFRIFLVSILVLFLAAFIYFLIPLPPDKELVAAPKPGMVGKPDYDVMHDSTDEIVSFHSKASEQQIRDAFEQFCLRRGLTKDKEQYDSQQAWYSSEKEHFGMGITVLPGVEQHTGTLIVSYFIRRGD